MPGISAEQKAERERIVDELAHEINLLRNLPREETYGKKGKIIKEAKELYGAWLGENTLKNRADHLWRTKSKSKSGGESVNASSSSNSTSSPESSNDIIPLNDSVAHNTEATSVAANTVSTSQSIELSVDNTDASPSTTPSTTPSTDPSSTATIESSTTHSTDASTTTNESSVDSHNSESSKERNDSSHTYSQVNN